MDESTQSGWRYRLAVLVSSIWMSSAVSHCPLVLVPDTHFLAFIGASQAARSHEASDDRMRPKISKS